MCYRFCTRGVELYQCHNDSDGEVVVPGEVEYGDTVYRVVQLTSYYAVYRCPNITSLVLPPTIERVGRQAFSNCPLLRRIVMQTEAPPLAEDIVFMNMPRNVRIEVPCGAADMYRDHPYWSAATIDEHCEEGTGRYHVAPVEALRRQGTP
ncbi:MAG: hypothetical protein IJ620_03655 [Bacteroidales bacterium]|nr:hypothetical protein [Bacteroidales bacterium]